MQTKALDEIGRHLADQGFDGPADPLHGRARHGGSVVPRAVLVAVGIDPDGKRPVLGVAVSPSEAEVRWRDFLADLQARGLHGVKPVVSDAHAGIKPTARLTGVAWQRCQSHLMRNATTFVPRPEMHGEVVADLRAVFDAADRPEAERQPVLAVKQYRTSAPRLSDWLEADVPEGLSVFASPRPHRRRLRTSNMLEQLNKELKRRGSPGCPPTTPRCCGWSVRC